MSIEAKYAAARAAHLAAARRALRRHNGDCVLSHETAAIGWGLPTYTIPAQPHLTRSSGCRRTRGRTHVAVAELPPTHVTAITGGSMTTPGRTAIDIARSRPFAEALVTADAAMRRGVSRAELEQLVAQHDNWPGMRSAQQVVRWADERSESACESVVRARIILLGLPMPEPQVWLPIGDQWARVDFLWEGCGLVGEADGRVKYTDERVLWDEKQRRDAIEDERTVIRWTWAQAHAPDEVFRARLLKAMQKAERLQAVLRQD